MEPISMAVAAFSAIKAGVSAGKELHSLAGDIGKLFDAIDATKSEHQKKKNRKILSVNEEAMETFIAKQKAQDLEKELRELIVMTRGISAWHELLKLRVDIKKKRKEAERLAKQKKQEMMETIALGAFGVLLLIGLIGGFIFFVMIKTGRL